MNVAMWTINIGQHRSSKWFNLNLCEDPKCFSAHADRGAEFDPNNNNIRA